MPDPFEKVRLYEQLDDHQPLDEEQLARLMKQAAEFPEEFRDFDLPRLPIGCRPGDAASLELLCRILPHPVVGDHPGFNDFSYELAGGIDSCRPEEQLPLLRSWPSSVFQTLEDDFDGGAWDELLAPAPIAALVEAAGDVPVGVVSDAVRSRINRLGPDFLDRYFELFGVGPRAVVAAMSDEELDRLQVEMPWDVYELVEAATGDICSPSLVRLSREAVTADGPGGEGSAPAFLESLIALLAVPGEDPPRTVDDLLRGPVAATGNAAESQF
jgi:hypothetical protein